MSVSFAAFQKSVEKLKQQLYEVDTKRASNENTRKDCEDSKTFKRLFRDVLDQYSQFIECTLNEAPGQGRFLVPTQQQLLQALQVTEHGRTVLDGVFEPRRQCEGNSNNVRRDINEYRFLPMVPCNQECLKPIRIGACLLEPEPSIAEPEPEPSPTSSSLSCFNFKDDVYASNKVRIHNKVNLVFCTFSFYSTHILALWWTCWSSASRRWRFTSSHLDFGTTSRRWYNIKINTINNLLTCDLIWI